MSSINLQIKLYGRSVENVLGVKQWAEYAVLSGPALIVVLEDVISAMLLWSVDQEFEDPVAEGGAET